MKKLSNPFSKSVTSLKQNHFKTQGTDFGYNRNHSEWITKQKQTF